jgi:hypothetical protein
MSRTREAGLTFGCSDDPAWRASSLWFYADNVDNGADTSESLAWARKGPPLLARSAFVFEKQKILPCMIAIRRAQPRRVV